MNNADPYRCSRAYMDHHYGYLKDAADQDKWLERYGHTLDAMMFIIEAQEKPVPALTQAAIAMTRAAEEEESNKVQQQICETCSFYDNYSNKVWHCKQFSTLQRNCTTFQRRMS